MVRPRTLWIFYSTLYIFGAVNCSQNWTTPPLMLQETWHTRPYKNQNVTLIDSHEHVALYHDNIIEDYTGGYKNYYNVYQWPFSELSIAWKYVKDTYGPIGPDPHLFLILHGINSSRNSSSDPKCSSQSFLDPNGGRRNLIDCDFPTLQFQNGLLLETFQNFETIFSHIGDIIRHGAMGMYNDADRNICGSAMSDILFHDIYTHLRSNLSPADVDDWEEMLRNLDVSRTNRSICFYAWFIPIYKKYGGASVLKKYFELTKQYWQKAEQDGRYNAMNLGDFIHFWSAAAGEDLQHMAFHAFNWTVDHPEEFIKARKNYQFELLYDYTVNNEIPFWTKLTSKIWEVGFFAIVICTVTVILVVIMVLIVLIQRNASKLEKLENKVQDLTARDVDAFRVGSTHMTNNVSSDFSILSKPFNMAFEVPAERIVIDDSHVLGQGEFGIVYLGILKGENGTRDVKVAVKKSKYGTQVSHFKTFLSEIKIMAHLEKHENIAALIATVTLNISKCEVIAVLEFCEKGDLLDNLRSCRPRFRSLWNKSYSKWANLDYVEVNTITKQPSPSQPKNIPEITTLDLISWASEIANGMMYLSSKNIIHGDLAARNVLLTADNKTKISDFGLSRQLRKYSNYRKTSTTPIPWKWLAIEALTQRTFSIQSDVWSFGVTLWEIFTLGQEPYPGRIWDTNFENDLIGRDSLIGEPEFGNSEIHDLMMNCMQEMPAERFSFARIKTELEHIKANLET